ncbi:MAG: M23 family metallopeptidase [Tissierellia bacterium]|nr:M23 family metallopeptidase [Tissierellia bacterium]
MYRRRYKAKFNPIINLLIARLHYRRQIKKLVAVLIILVILLILKKLNNSISSNIIEIVDNSIKYEFSIKKDGKLVLDYGKKLLSLPEKALTVFNLVNNPKYPPPIEGTIYNPFGETRYLDGSTRFNNGVDIIPDEEKEPISIDKGVVKRIEDRNTKGYFVTIEHEDFITVYGYLINVYVKEGEFIDQGTKIGSLGTNKDGNKYLHFEVWKEGSPIDPTQYVDFRRKI